MKSYEVRNMKWENFPVEKIAKMPQTFRTMSGLYVCQTDVINFVNNIFNEIDDIIVANRSIVYILEEENIEFFENVEMFFTHNQQAVKKDDKRFIALMGTLKIPILRGIESKLARCISMYSELSEAEKKEFLIAVGEQPE